jgi:hypothetical protein
MAARRNAQRWASIGVGIAISLGPSGCESESPNAQNSTPATTPSAVSTSPDTRRPELPPGVDGTRNICDKLGTYVLTLSNKSSPPPKDTDPAIQRACKAAANVYEKLTSSNNPTLNFIYKAMKLSVANDCLARPIIERDSTSNITYLLGATLHPGDPTTPLEVTAIKVDKVIPDSDIYSGTFSQHGGFYEVTATDPDGKVHTVPAAMLGINCANKK